MKFQVSAIALGCIALLSGCGGGGSSSSDGAQAQSVSFDFPGGASVGIPPNVSTVKLVATASGGGAVTYTSNTPDTCTVNGDTLSLIKAGECSVNANQAGGNGYAPATARQLFVIPKNPQVIAKFQNPGWQPVGGAPVQLAATFDTGLPVTFSSKTPSVCSVSGTTMTPLADGICTVTATQAGNDTYATTTVDKNIPIGAEKPAKLNFVTGYKNRENSKEAPIGHAGGNGWCFDCDATVPADGSTFTFFAKYTPNPPAGWQYGHEAFQLYGPGIVDADLYDGGMYRGGIKAFTLPSAPPKGVQIEIEGALNFNLAQNAEWFNSTDNRFNVEIFLAHFNTSKLDANGNACYVTLKSTVKPTAAAATNYSLGLKDKFAISQTCGLTGLDIWTELQTYPVVEIKFSAALPNGTVKNAAGEYRTEFKLTGPVYFQ